MNNKKAEIDLLKQYIELKYDENYYGNIILTMKGSEGIVNIRDEHNLKIFDIKKHIEKSKSI